MAFIAQNIRNLEAGMGYKADVKNKGNKILIKNAESDDITNLK